MSDEQLPRFTVDDIERDLPLLHFERFGQDEAYALGTAAAEIVQERGLVMAVQIVMDGHVLYKATFGGVSADTADWLRRKANVAMLRGEPTLLVRRRLEAHGETAASAGLEDADRAAHGGSLPLFVGEDLVATFTASGEPDVVDHDVAMAAVRRFRGR